MTKRQSEKGEAPKQVRALQGFLIQNQNQERIMANSTQTAPGRAITVPFHGADLYVVEHNGQPYTPMKPIVEGMGLDWGGQHKKVAANESRWGVSVMEIPSAGGVQMATCLLLRKLPAWLATIDAGRVKNLEARARVIQYQNECDDVLWQYWNDGIAINPRAYAVHPDQTLSAEQADTLRFMLTENVKKLPKEKQAGAMVKGWSKLKAHFKTDYRHIPAGEFHEAVSILARHVAEWELVDDTPKPAKQPTVQEIVAEWVKKIEGANGYPAFLFQPLVDAVLRKSGKRLAVVARGQMVVDRRNLAAVWADLGKLQSRIDALGCPVQDFPPSWWEDHAIAA
ncbi:MAG TPA: phage antirepressor N-terminal domain-containing protein [Acidovorax sp.]|nr:phage antirepressor N-terminal domain-containing protein [Acidovorax sp.]